MDVYVGMNLIIFFLASSHRYLSFPGRFGNVRVMLNAIVPQGSTFLENQEVREFCQSEKVRELL